MQDGIITCHNTRVCASNKQYYSVAIILVSVWSCLSMNKYQDYRFSDVYWYVNNHQNFLQDSYFFF
jgi:hypothetical protein